MQPDAIPSNVPTIQLDVDHCGWLDDYPVNTGVAVYFAAASGDIELMRQCIAHGAASNVCDISGVRAIDAVDGDGVTALMVAISRRHTACTQMLIEAGAGINIVEWKDGRTALSIACQVGDLPTVKLLVEAGADVNLGKSMCGTSPVVTAMTWGNIDMVMGLVEQGALEVSANANKYCAYPAILDVLLRAGAELPALDETIEVLDDYYGSYVPANAAAHSFVSVAKALGVEPTEMIRLATAADSAAGRLAVAMIESELLARVGRDIEPAPAGDDRCGII